MPEDLEILWIEAVVFVQPVSERGAEWLSRVIPGRYWEMRLVSHDDLESFAVAARKQRLTIGGIHLPSSEGLDL